MTWRIAASLQRLREEVDRHAPLRRRGSDGSIGDASHATRVSDHNPYITDDAGVGVVRAIDITHDPAGGIDGNLLAEHLRDLGRAGDPRLAYVIFNRRIASRKHLWAWQRYTGPNPHRTHVHVSVVEAAAGYDSQAPWRISAGLPSAAGLAPPKHGYVAAAGDEGMRPIAGDDRYDIPGGGPPPPGGAPVPASAVALRVPPARIVVPRPPPGPPSPSKQPVGPPPTTVVDVGGIDLTHVDLHHELRPSHAGEGGADGEGWIEVHGRYAPFAGAHADRAVAALSPALHEGRGRTAGRRRVPARVGVVPGTLELRHFTEAAHPSGGARVRYAFRGAEGCRPRSRMRRDAVGEASDAFFVWLALPRSSFWVNLNPDQPDVVIDPRLGRTDVGRVLLEADLALKRTTARLIHPDTVVGRAFWAEVGRAGDVPVSAASRVWIVPGRASVWESAGSVHVVDATLDVHMEAQPAGRDSQVRWSDERFVSRCVHDAYRRRVLPEIVRQVNASAVYAPLRRAYTSRIVAEWYRRRKGSDGAFAGIIDSGDASAWPARRPWSAIDVFGRYRESAEHGEFAVSRLEFGPGYMRRGNLFYGGIDLKALRLDVVDTLPDAVEDPLRKALADPAGSLAADGAVWVSGTSVVRELPETPTGYEKALEDPLGAFSIGRVQMPRFLV